jgi:hypothetical protein
VCRCRASIGRVAEHHASRPLIGIRVPQLSGREDSGHEDNSAPWKSLISCRAARWRGSPEHSTARAFDEAASPPPSPQTKQPRRGASEGDDHEAGALVMEIPLDLERRAAVGRQIFPHEMHRQPNASPGKRKMPAGSSASDNRRSMVWAASRSRGSLERLDQRLRRERLCEIGEASGLKRSHPDGRVVVPSHVDDRHGNASSLEAMPQLDA